jgi:hypothetical protein
LPKGHEIYDQLPNDMLGTLERLYSKSPPLKRKAVASDLEILFDELFYLQKLAVQYDIEEFIEHIPDYRRQHSEFYFDETLLLPDRVFYPPLFPLFASPAAVRNMEKLYTKLVRTMIADVTELVMKYYAEPSELSRKKANKILPHLLNGIRSLNPFGSLAVFTTNYDLSIENWCLRQGNSIYYSDGTHSARWDPASSYELQRESVCLFYLHGCARWVLKLKESSNLHRISFLGDGLLVADSENRIYSGASIHRVKEYNFESLYGDPDQNQYPCLLFPSTVKRRYVHSPPFNFSYEQFWRSLQAAKVLVIAGYSGRDETFKEMLYSVLSKNRRLHIIVLDIGAMPIHMDIFLPQQRSHLIQDDRGICPEAINRAISLCRQLLD